MRLKLMWSMFIIDPICLIDDNKRTIYQGNGKRIGRRVRR
jgi:hypothetical protein